MQSSFLASLYALLQHPHIQELKGFSGVRMSPLVQWVFAFTPHKRIHLDTRQLMNIMRQTKLSHPTVQTPL